MISFFESSEKNIFAVESYKYLSEQDCNKLRWLFGNSKKLKEKSILNNFIGPRSSMISPWSTNAVEMCENMGIDGITRIEKNFYDKYSNFSFLLYIPIFKLQKSLEIKLFCYYLSWC